MSRSANLKYLLGSTLRQLVMPTPARVAVLAACVVLFVAARLISSAGAPEAPATGSFSFSPLELLLMWAGFFGLFYGLRLLRLRRIRAQFRQGLTAPTSQPLLSILEREFAKMRLPDLDAIAAAERGYIHLMYGEFEAARRELNALRWENRAPYVQGLGALLASRLCLFETREHAPGLAAAQRALAATDLGKWPGAAKARVHFQSGVDVAQALDGTIAQDALLRLEQQAASGAWTPTRVFAVAALLGHATRMGDAPRKARYAQQLDREAPHCRGLRLDR